MQMIRNVSDIDDLSVAYAVGLGLVSCQEIELDKDVISVLSHTSFSLNGFHQPSPSPGPNTGSLFQRELIEVASFLSNHDCTFPF